MNTLIIILAKLSARHHNDQRLPQLCSKLILNASVATQTSISGIYEILHWNYLKNLKKRHQMTIIKGTDDNVVLPHQTENNLIF